MVWQTLKIGLLIFKFRRKAGSYSNPQIVFTYTGIMRAVMAHMLGLSSARAQCLAIPHFGCLHAHLMDAAHAVQHHGGASQLQSLRPLLA